VKLIDPFSGSGGLFVCLIAARIKIFCQGRKRTPHWVRLMCSTLGTSCVNRNLGVLRVRGGGLFTLMSHLLTACRELPHILFVGLLNLI
jgi:hypothetical protein